MQTKSRIAELLAALLLLAWLIWIPAFAIGRLVDPPYNLLCWMIVMANAWRVFRRRERRRLSELPGGVDRAGRVPSHGLSR